MEHDDAASRKSGSVEFESSCHGIPKDYIKRLSMLDVRAEGGNDIVIDEKSSVDTDSRPLLRVSVYGGKKKEVFASIERHIGVSEEAELYHTWVNVSAMKRLAFLFESGECRWHNRDCMHVHCSCLAPCIVRFLAARDSHHCAYSHGIVQRRGRSKVSQGFRQLSEIIPFDTKNHSGL
jgi:hypothetical protein